MKKENYCLNFIKACAAFGILYMHTGYDCLASSIITCLSRFAVLTFFMISGYYCFYEDRETVAKKLPNKVKHIGAMCLWSLVIYFMWSILYLFLCKTPLEQIGKSIIECFSLKSVISFLLFNQVSFAGILWFLFALLYCYLIMVVVNKKNWYKAAYIISFLLVVVHIISRGIIQYNGIIAEDINIVLYRNFIFMGFPFFMLGNLLHKYQNKIANKFSNKAICVFIIIGLVISCIERFIVPLELYWGTVLAAFFIFVFAIKNSEKKIVPIISYIGQKYSMQIYILHPIINQICKIIKLNLGLEKIIVLDIINPVIVFVIVLLLAKLWSIILNKLKQKEEL